jgi:hypothetical protein
VCPVCVLSARRRGFCVRESRSAPPLMSTSGNAWVRFAQYQATALARNCEALNVTKPNMKSLVLTLAFVLFGAAATMADDKTVTTTTSSTVGTGTITEYSPGSTFVVKETSGPVTYKYGKKVTYVTKSGKTLSDDEVKTRIKVGSPVSVHYATEGDTKVINKVEIDD